LRRIVLLLAALALLAAGFTAAGGASSLRLGHVDAKCKKGYKRVKGKCVKVKKKKKTTTKRTTTAKTTTAATTTTPTTPAPKGGFPSGVYYVVPSASDPAAGTIKLLGGSIPSIVVHGRSGFDVGRVLVWVDGNEVHVVQPGGAARVLFVDGLYQLSHPSLAPEGTSVVVQATQTPPEQEPDPSFVTSYVIDLSNGSWRFLAPTSALPYDGNDFPTWSPAGDTIAYESTELKDGRDCTVVNLADATSGTVKNTLRRANDAACETPASVFWEGPRGNLAFSQDAKRLLLVGMLQVVDLTSGADVASLQEKVLAGLGAAGYTPDDRFPVRVGTSPVALAGGFSPDGTKIVFDGSVRKGNAYYQLVMRINLDGSGFTILDGPFAENPRFFAGVTYTVLSTAWNS